MEEMYIKTLENCIRGIKLGLKKPVDVAVTVSQTHIKLKVLNDGMAEELIGKYKEAVKIYNEKLANKK